MSKYFLYFDHSSPLRPCWRLGKKKKKKKDKTKGRRGKGGEGGENRIIIINLHLGIADVKKLFPEAKVFIDDSVYPNLVFHSFPFSFSLFLFLFLSFSLSLSLSPSSSLFLTFRCHRLMELKKFVLVFFLFSFLPFLFF